jgi:hypothetical protein
VVAGLPQLVARHASNTPFTTVTGIRISGTFDLATDAQKQKQQDRIPQFYCVFDTSRDVGWKSFDRGFVGKGAVGCGVMIINDLGGPCPPPSCASATVARVDAVNNRAIIAYFILNLLRRSNRRR